MTYGGGSINKYPKTDYQKRVNKLIAEHDEKLKKEYAGYLKSREIKCLKNNCTMSFT